MFKYEFKKNEPPQNIFCARRLAFLQQVEAIIINTQNQGFYFEMPIWFYF